MVNSLKKKLTIPKNNKNNSIAEKKSEQAGF